MKLTPFFSLLMASLGNAGPISDMVTNNPEQVMKIITAGTYPQVLALVRDAYTESKTADGATAQYVYVLALDQATADKKIALAVDFSLAQTDMSVKQLGARAISTAVLKGVTIDAAQRQQAIAKLKEQLAQAANPSRAAFEFARQASKALVFLGDDTGLDVWLTDSQTVGNYAKKDGWQSTSDAAVFTQLKTQYDQLAAVPENANPDVERTIAATYELCRVRRTQSREIKPISPLANLDRLLKP